MKKYLLLILPIIIFLSCQDFFADLTESPDVIVEVSTDSLDVEDLIAYGSIESIGDGIIKYGHVWTSDGSNPVYVENAVSQTEFEENIKADDIFTSALTVIPGEVNYKVRSYAISIYDKVYYGNLLANTKIITFKRNHPGFVNGEVIRQLKNGTYMIGASDGNSNAIVIRTNEEGDIVFQYDFGMLLDSTTIVDMLEFDNGFLIAAEFWDERGYTLININTNNGQIINSKEYRAENAYYNFGKMGIVGGNADFTIHGEIYVVGSEQQEGEQVVSAVINSFGPFDLNYSTNHIVVGDFPISITDFTFAKLGDVLLSGTSGEGGMITRIETVNYNVVSQSLLKDADFGILKFDGLINSMSDDNEILILGRTCLGECIEVNSWRMNISSGEFTNSLESSPVISAYDGFFVDEGNLVFVGTTGDQVGSPLFIKINVDGTIAFEKDFEITSINFSQFKSVVQTSDGGYAITGVNNGELFQVKTSPQGNVEQ